ncbi:hypothetical protein GALL_431900 [mine drainage metagenome]|uniref:Uncharacterized protein n=1 Tax=mine drainage metagenome TaxID=410659 RepID=A0A1J5PW99_9ZZZZ
MQFLADDPALSRRTCQDFVEFPDVDHQAVVLVDDLLTFESGKSAQLHFENCVCLDFVDFKESDEAKACLFHCGAASDQGDYLVESIECFEVAAQNVSAFLFLCQAEFGSPDNYLDLVFNVVANEFVKTQGSRHVVDQSQHVGAESILELRVLVEVV